MFIVLISLYTEWGMWRPSETTLPAWLALAYQSTLGTLAHFWFHDNEVLTIAHLVGWAIVMDGVMIATRGQ